MAAQLRTRARARAPLVAVAALLAAAVVPTAGAGHGQEAAAAQAATTDVPRLSGASRYETAVAISQRAFPDGSARAYLARGDVFADALAAGVLTDGPVLLVPSCGEPPSVVVAEIDRLDPVDVVALGGPAAVCGDLLASVAAGRPTSRLAGASRYATAVAISQFAFPDGSADVFLARADDSPDAVVGGALTTGPILLVPPSGPLPVDTRTEIGRLAPARVVALGGIGAISDATLAEAAAGRETLRLGGADRFATAATVARHAFPGRSAAVYLARADVFADAVAAGSLADGPVLLVPQCGGLPTSVTTTLEALSPSEVIGLGGSGAVCDQNIEDAQAFLRPQNTMTPSDAAEPLDEEQSAAMRSYDAGSGELVFDADADLSDVAVGDIVVSAPTEQAPDGLLRRVTSVGADGAGWVLQTESAALADAVEEAHLTHTVRVDASSIASSDVVVPGVTIEPITASGRSMSSRELAGTASLGGVRVRTGDEIVFYDGDADQATVDDQIAVDLTAELFLDLTVDWDNDGLDLNQLDLTAAAGDDVEVTFRVGGKTPLFDEPLVKRLGTTHLGNSTVLVYGFPVVLSYDIDWDVVLDASVTAETRGGVRHAGTVAATATWIDGVDGIATEFATGGGWSAIEPQVHGAAEARAGLRATPRVSAYGLAGPAFPLELYGRAKADVTGSSGDGLSGTAGLYAGMDLGAKLEVKWDVFPHLPIFAKVEVVPEVVIREWRWPEATGHATVGIVEPAHLSPHRFASTGGEDHVLRALFTGLVEYETGMATTFPAVGDSITTTDNQHWAVRLRPWTFHDGSPVTPASFVDAWNWAADADNAGSSEMGWRFAEIQGYEDVASPDGDPLTGMSGLTITGDRTFTIDLVAPDQTFLSRLGMVPFFPLPQAYFDDPEGFAVSPVGNGPFMLDGPWQPGVGIDLVRFEGYSGYYQPQLATMDFSFHADHAAAYEALVRGEVDVVPTVPVASIGDAQARFGAGFGAAATATVQFISFPSTVDWLADTDRRAALSMAIDRDALVALSAAGTRLAASTFIPPVIDGHRVASCSYWDHDATAARQRWDAAGGYDGTIELWFHSSHRDWMTAVADQWTEVLGLDPGQVVLVERDFVEILDHLEAGTVTGPYRLGWGMDYPHPASFLQPHLSSELPPAGVNYVRYVDADYDAYVDAGLAQTDVSSALGWFEMAEDRLCSDVPSAPVLFGQRAWAASASVAGAMVDVFGQLAYTRLGAAGSG